MSITFHLDNFPTLNQNHEPNNPFPDNNASMNCVPTSIAASLTWFTGTQFFGNQVIDQDSSYGPNYKGGTSALYFEDYCAKQGVNLYPFNGSPEALVAEAHREVHLFHPVLVTVPGQWNNPATSGQNPGDVTHVMVVCGDGPGSLQVMNPWTGAFEEYSDDWFKVKLCFGQIWPMERSIMKLTDVSQYFEDGGNGQWRCKIATKLPLLPDSAKANHIIIGGILQFYQAWPQGFKDLGLPLTNEVQVPGAPAGVVFQVFERKILVWDPPNAQGVHAYDNPPGVTGPCYAAHIDLAINLLQSLLQSPAASPPPAPAPAPSKGDKLLTALEDALGLPKSA